MAERLEAYVETHSDEYERVRFFEVRTPIEEAAERLVADNGIGYSHLRQ